jgi:RNA polymerase primary sigma factor
MRPLPDCDLGQDRSPRRAEAAGCPLDASEVSRLTSEASYIVGMVARQYATRGVAFEDLVAAGNVGLVGAAHRFDAQRGIQFATYAAWWVRKEIVEFIGKERLLIHIPRYAFALKRRVIEDGDAGMSARQVRRAEQAFVTVVSLNTSRGDDGETLEDRIADPGSLLPVESVEFGEAKLSVERALGALRPRERAVVELRYGLGGGEPMTLIDIAARLGLSRERIRQIEGEALARLRGVLGVALPSRIRLGGRKLVDGRRRGGPQSPMSSTING